MLVIPEPIARTGRRLRNEIGVDITQRRTALLHMTSPSKHRAGDQNESRERQRPNRWFPRTKVCRQCERVAPARMSHESTRDVEVTARPTLRRRDVVRQHKVAERRPKRMSKRGVVQVPDIGGSVSILARTRDGRIVLKLTLDAAAFGAADRAQILRRVNRWLDTVDPPLRLVPGADRPE